MSTLDYTHIPYSGPEALTFAHTVVHIVDDAASDPLVVSTLKEHAYDGAVKLISTTEALNRAEGAERVAVEAQDVAEDAADGAVRAGFGYAGLLGGTEARSLLRAVCGGLTYGEIVRLSGHEQVHTVRGFAQQARAHTDRFGLTEKHLDNIETTNEALATTTTAAARLARRAADAAFVKCARVCNKILTALLPRETLATLLPRFERKRASAAE